VSTEDQLLDAILANRDDRDAYRVYGDMLEQRGDPRGKLIAMQLRADETNLEDGELLVRIKHHLSQYRALVPAIDQWNGRFKWKWGFLVDVELDDPEPDELAMVLDHPSCAAVQSLRLELDGADVAPVLAKLAQRRPTIERLVVSYESEDSGSGDRVDGAVWDRLPRLEHLTIDGPSDLAAPRFHSIRSNLRGLVLGGVPFENDADWNLPEVREIAWNAVESIEPLTPLWQCELPALHTLSLEGLVDTSLFDHAGFMARVARLEHLAVPRNTVGIGTMATALLAHADKLEHLESLRTTGPVSFADDTDEERELWAEVRRRLPNLFDINYE
jgi:uncharacterized protein (TIGR02996 family)